MPDQVSPANEFIGMYESLYEKPHANIALINAGIQKAPLAWHLLKNEYLLLVAKAKIVKVDGDGTMKIALDLAKLNDWEKETLVRNAYMIDDLATRVMSESPRSHSAHRALIDRFNTGNMSTSISQIPGLESLEGEKKRKSSEPSPMEDIM